MLLINYVYTIFILYLILSIGSVHYIPKHQVHKSNSRSSYGSHSSGSITDILTSDRDNHHNQSISDGGSYHMKHHNNKRRVYHVCYHGSYNHILSREEADMLIMDLCKLTREKSVKLYMVSSAMILVVIVVDAVVVITFLKTLIVTEEMTAVIVLK